MLRRIIRRRKLQQKPTERANVFPEDESFEQLLKRMLEQLEQGKAERTEFTVQVPWLVRLQVMLHAHPLSPVPLTVAGCLCTLVLHVTGAPEWAQLGGLVLPAVLGLLTSRLRHS